MSNSHSNNEDQLECDTIYEEDIDSMSNSILKKTHNKRFWTQELNNDKDNQLKNQDD